MSILALNLDYQSSNNTLSGHLRTSPFCSSVIMTSIYHTELRSSVSNLVRVNSILANTYLIFFQNSHFSAPFASW